MFEQAQLILYGQVNERRKWGVVLLALSLLTAAPVAWVMYGHWIGWMQYVAAAGGGAVAFIFGATVWGKVLSYVRDRWFA